MYTREQLARYPYFAQVFEDNIEVNYVLDQLTGLVSRGHILWFAQWLIDHQVPFSFAMLDLDNFKFVNDTYGHHVGDGVLTTVANDLREFLGDRGVAGRFGGDEFLIVNLEDISYDAKKEFFKGMFLNRVLRKNIEVDGCAPYITGTIGCATYPADARDYDTLFLLIDKTLYRGKTKGRNCHIIYVEEKHKNIEIHRIAKRGLFTTFHGMIRKYELTPGILNKLNSVTPLVMEELQVSDLYYVGRERRLRSVRNPEINEDAGDISNLLFDDDLYATNNLADMETKCPAFYAKLKKRDIETVLIVRVGIAAETDGYLLCAEPRSRRIWQEAECAILYFLAKLLAASIRLEGETLI
ncbi:MAG: GGDEF domain-containing protein [Clostridia bacterium]|nr:GGDEF domain-containing protein [Clostridia bacterium]